MGQFWNHDRNKCNFELFAIVPNFAHAAFQFYTPPKRNSLLSFLFKNHKEKQNVSHLIPNKSKKNYSYCFLLTIKFETNLIYFLLT